MTGKLAGCRLRPRKLEGHKACSGADTASMHLLLPACSGVKQNQLLSIVYCMRTDCCGDRRQQVLKLDEILHSISDCIPSFDLKVFHWKIYAIFSLCFTFNPSNREVLCEKLCGVLKDLNTISNAIKIGIYKSIF